MTTTKASEATKAPVLTQVVTVEVLPASGVLHAWLSVDGVRAAWLGHRVDGSKVFAQSVEVREGYQGRGLARTLIEMVAAHHGVSEIQHTGGFTPEGYNLHHLFARPEGYGPARVEYKSMGFICDWDEGTKHNRWCGCDDDED